MVAGRARIWAFFGGLAQTASFVDFVGTFPILVEEFIIEIPASF